MTDNNWPAAPYVPPKLLPAVASGAPTLDTEDGRFQKGERRSIATEFKPGEHWRKPQAFRDRDWLYCEYVEKQRTSGDIASEFGVTDAAILFWLRKHEIPRRTVRQSRVIKHWGASGEANGMYGMTGDKNPRWRGGITPDRQAVYISPEWAKSVRTVWKRDGGYCQRCKGHYTSIGEMHIHHIVSFSAVELRCEPTNLILLCDGCHKWVHSRNNASKEFIRE